MQLRCRSRVRSLGNERGGARDRQFRFRHNNLERPRYSCRLLLRCGRDFREWHCLMGRRRVVVIYPIAPGGPCFGSFSGKAHRGRHFYNRRTKPDRGVGRFFLATARRWFQQHSERIGSSRREPFRVGRFHDVRNDLRQPHCPVEWRCVGTAWRGTFRHCTLSDFL